MSIIKDKEYQHQWESALRDFEFQMSEVNKPSTEKTEWLQPHEMVLVIIAIPFCMLYIFAEKILRLLMKDRFCKN